MNLSRSELKNKAIELRQMGRSYQEIEQALGTKIAKGTLSYWCRKIALSADVKAILRQRALIRLKEARKVSIAVRKQRRIEYLDKILSSNGHLANLSRSPQVAKIILAVLYLGEGAKNLRKASVGFGNSDPDTIKLFMSLLRSCYTLDESRFRCTVQCRADQNTKELEIFWSKVTKIPPNLFYKSRIDKRSIGVVSKNREYKGVCRIDYFSANIFFDLLMAIKVIKSITDSPALTNFYSD